METMIRPGQVWLDTSGHRIQAHGGSLFFEDGIYYWYGENKEKTDGKNGIWHWGVRCYRSKDLVNWEDLGLLIPPDEDDPSSPLYPKAQMDRPHIIFNRFTKKYVCWVKVMNGPSGQAMTVLTADRLTGPYTMVRKNLRPLGMNAGDFDLSVAPDGKAYCYFERVHSETICADLTQDYTDVTGYYSTHFPHPNPPYVREGTSHFVRQGKHYLVTSGTTGYLPNPSEIAIAGTWHGPYTVLGNPHPDDPSGTSFHSQISSVFRVPGKKDLYIALADRWVPGAMDLDAGVYQEIYEAAFTGRREEIPAIAARHRLPQKDLLRIFGDTARNTSVADYVWLPIRFIGPDEAHPNGQVTIPWRDAWSPEEFEDEDSSE